MTTTPSPTNTPIKEGAVKGPATPADPNEELRLQKKRAAARLRQQRCRARKKEALMKQRLQELSKDNPDMSLFKEKTPKRKKGEAAANTPGSTSSQYAGQNQWGWNPFMMWNPMMMYHMHPNGMPPMMGNPMTCPPDVMGLPAKSPIKSPSSLEKEEKEEKEKEVQHQESV